MRHTTLISITGLLALAIFSFTSLAIHPSEIRAQWLESGMQSASAVANNENHTTSEKRDNPEAYEDWFYSQRSFGLGHIPKHARANAIFARNAMANGGKGLASQSSGTVQWKIVGPLNTKASGSHDGRVNCIAIDPTNANIAYCGAAMGGVWKTTNQGVTWVPLTDQTISLAMGAIAIDPLNTKTIYAGTGEFTENIDAYYGEGMLKSTDAGKSWSSAGLNNVEAFSRIICHPTIEGRVYASTARSGGGVYLSTDGGVSWTKLAGGLPPSDVTDLALTQNGSNDVLYAGVPSHGVFLSTDGGNSWNLASPTSTTGSFSDMRRINLDVDPSNWQTVVAMSINTAGDFEDLQQSTDVGADWSSIAGDLTSNGSIFSFQGDAPQGWYDAYVRMDPKNPSHLFVGALSVWQTTDDGNSWQDVGHAYAGGMHPDQHALEFAPSNNQIIYVGCDGGPWLSTDAGNSLNSQQDNMAVTQFYGISVDQTVPDLTYGGTQDNGTQGGSSTADWVEIGGGDGGTVAVDQNQPTRVFYMRPGGVDVERYDGNTSVAIGLPVGNDDVSGWVKPLVYDSKNSILYAATNYFYYSRTYGQTWVRSGVKTPTNSDSNNITYIDPAGDGNNVVIGTAKGVLYTTTSNGTAWTNKSTGLPTRSITCVRYNPSNHNTIYVTFSGFGGGHVFRSDDAGNTWKDISGNIPDIPCNSIVIDPGNSNALYLGTDVGVFFSPDNGATWMQYGFGLPNVAVLDMAIQTTQRVLRVGTHGRSIWQAPLSSDITAMITPTGGSIWYIGDTALIAWHGFTGEGSATIQLSLDGGQTWITIATDVTGDSYFISNMHYPASGNVLVKVFNIQDTVVSALFMIKQRLAGSTLNVINELPIYMYDIAWDADDNTLWATDYSPTDTKIYKIDPDNGTMLGSVNLGAGHVNMTGIKYDPKTKHLFIHSANQTTNTSQYYEVTTSGQVVHSNPSLAVYGTGILVREDTLYLVDRDPAQGTNMIYHVSVSNPQVNFPLPISSRESPFGGRCLTYDPTTNTLLHTWTDFQGTTSTNTGTLYDSYLLRLNPEDVTELSASFVQLGGNQQVNVRGLQIDPRDGYKSAWVTVLDDATGGTSAKLVKVTLVDGPAGNLAVTKPVNTEDYSMAQNYPNPFNRTTDIAYTLKSSADVSIEVYDALGRLLTRSSNSYEGQGSHSRSISLSSVPTGTYVYSLVVNGVTVDRRKMTLLK
jgi:hypothetical protein